MYMRIFGRPLPIHSDFCANVSSRQHVRCGLLQMLDEDYISLSAPSSRKTSLNGGNTIPMPRHTAPHSRPTATAHYIGQRDRRGHEVISLCTATRLWTCRHSI